MRNINIGIIGENVGLKTLVFKKILKQYTNYDVNLYNEENASKYWFFKMGNSDINLLDIKKDDFENSWNVLNICNACIFVVNCNDYKYDYNKYYYMCYTLGIKNVLFLICNLENFPSSDGKTILNEITKYLKRKNKKTNINGQYIPFYTQDFLDENNWFNEYKTFENFITDIKFPEVNHDNQEVSMIISNKFQLSSRYTAINGVLENGVLKKGDVLCIKPSNIVVNVKKIQKNHVEIEKAYPYDYIGIMVDSHRINVNDVGVSFNSEIKKTSKIVCRVMVLSDTINIDENFKLYYNQTHVNCKINLIYKNLRLDISNIETLPKSLSKNKVGIIQLELAEEIFINKYDDNTRQGRILLVDGADNIACMGIVKLIK